MRKIMYLFFITTIVLCGAGTYGMDENIPHLNCEKFEDLIADDASLLARLVGQEQGGNYCFDLSRAEAELHTKRDIITQRGILITQYHCSPSTVNFIRLIYRKNKDRGTLIDALRECNYAEVRTICKKNPYAVNAYALDLDYGGVAAPLHCAFHLYGGKKEKDQSILTRCIGFLLYARACVNAVDYNGDTPLHKATTQEQIKLLWLNGADRDKKNNIGLTPAMSYVCNKKQDLALFSVKSGGVNTVLRDNNGDTLLHYAVRANHAELIDRLLCEGKQFEIDNQCYGVATSCVFTSSNIFNETPAELARGAHKNVQKVMEQHILAYLRDAFCKGRYYVICNFIGKYDWINYKPFFEWAKESHKSGFMEFKKSCVHHKEMYPSLLTYLSAHE